jgi:hypothetical protein
MITGGSASWLDEISTVLLTGLWTNGSEINQSYSTLNPHTDVILHIKTEGEHAKLTAQNNHMMPSLHNKHLR